MRKGLQKLNLIYKHRPARGTGRDGTGRGGLTWDGTGPEGLTWDGRDGTGRDGMGRGGTGRDGTGRGGTGRDGTGSGRSSRSKSRSGGGNVAEIDHCLTMHAQVKFDFPFGETLPQTPIYAHTCTYMNIIKIYK